MKEKMGKWVEGHGEKLELACGNNPVKRENH